MSEPERNLKCRILGHVHLVPPKGGTLFYQCPRCNFTVHQGGPHEPILYYGVFYYWPKFPKLHEMPATQEGDR